TTALTIETGASLHFAWAADNTTPLVITMPSGAVGTNTITTETGTTLYMTHSQGLDDGTNLTNGNVQQFAQANRSFSQTADFWYVGKANQVTGNAITTVSTNKLIGVDMSNSIYETSLTANIITSGKLILTSGVLKTTDTELLTLEDGATVHTNVAGSNGEPGSASSWVDGPMKKVGNDAFVFPLGETIWAPIGISAPSVVTDEFTGEYFHEPYSDIVNVEATMDRVSDIDYWDITRNNGSSLPTVTGYWKDDRYGISDIADVVIAHYDGGTWKDMGSSSVSGTTNNGEVQNSVVFTSFSPITLGFKDALLPIELLSFDAKYESDDVLVNWATASETNNDYFTLERSKDGRLFELVTNYPGAGNSSRIIHYEIIDYTPYAGKSYYRLKQTDFDNTVSYSKIVSVSNFDNNELVQVSVWRNENILFVQAENLTKNNDILVQIHDMAGRLLFVKSFDSYSENIQIDLGNRIFTKGIYTVTVIADEFYKTQKLIW
ncbi:MAG: T9SS type A sorting domain-containing protein, partial [Bacteroidota bacterium]|nr:T9SS type A sorting domain-containing protein [Bacteroidota bacterium]